MKYSTALPSELGSRTPVTSIWHFQRELMDLHSFSFPSNMKSKSIAQRVVWAQIKVHMIMQMGKTCSKNGFYSKNYLWSPCMVPIHKSLSWWGFWRCLIFLLYAGVYGIWVLQTCQTVHCNHILCITVMSKGLAHFFLNFFVTSWASETNFGTGWFCKMESSNCLIKDISWEKYQAVKLEDSISQNRPVPKLSPPFPWGATKKSRKYVQDFCLSI